MSGIKSVERKRSMASKRMAASPTWRGAHSLAGGRFGFPGPPWDALSGAATPPSSHRDSKGPHCTFPPTARNPTSTSLCFSCELSDCLSQSLVAPLESCPLAHYETHLRGVASAKAVPEAGRLFPLDAVFDVFRAPGPLPLCENPLCDAGPQDG